MSTPTEVDPRHAAVAAKWDELRAFAREHGTPIIIRFFDGETEVITFGSPETREVYIHSGDFNADGSVGGEILCSFGVETLAKLLPTLLHALNVATGLTKEAKR